MHRNDRQRNRQTGIVAALAGLLPGVGMALLPGLATAGEQAPGLVVIGATAKSSTEIIRQALAAGYTVTGVARRPEDVALKDVALKDPHLKIRKGELYLTGTRHKVGGLTFAPDRTLWAFSQLTPTVVEIAPTGVQKSVRKFSDRMYSSVTFGQDGSLYFCEHMMGTQTGHPSVTTRFRLLPGRDVIGDGHVFRHNADGKLVQEYATVANGGMFGFLAVTSTVLADNDTRLIFVSETGSC